MASRSVPKTFEAGDTVLVERNGSDVRRNKKNWDNQWTDLMDSAVGKWQIVTRVNQYGVELADGFKYPPSVLRLIKRGDKAYFLPTDKIVVARHVEGAPNWNKVMLEKSVGKVLDLHIDARLKRVQCNNVRLSDGWFYNLKCLELFDGQSHPDQPAAAPHITITEPLQMWERF